MFMPKALSKSFFIAVMCLSGSMLSPISLAEESNQQQKKVTEVKKKLIENSFVILDTNRGQLKLELFDAERPKTVKNFLKYVNDGFYDNTIFHRLIPNFVIQGGGFSKELAKKKTRKAIKNEASDKINNIRGSIAMARLSSPNSASSQFFINLKDNRSLDFRDYNPGYTVFGRIAEGMEFVDNMVKSKTGNIGMFRDVPIDAIIIERAYVTAAEKPTDNQNNRDETPLKSSAET